MIAHKFPIVKWKISSESGIFGIITKFYFLFILCLWRATVFSDIFYNEMKINFFWRQISSIISFLLCAIFCTSVYARTLNLEEALTLSEENDPDLRKQRLALADSQRRNNNMWNSFLPSLSAGGSVSNTHNFADSSKWNWGASASANLSFTFGTPSAMQLLNLNYRSAVLTYQNLLETKRASVSTTFYSLIAKQKNLKILEDSQRLAKTVYEQTLKNYRSGLASELDMLKSQYAYSSIEPQIQEARSSYLEGLASFAVSLGIDELRDLVLEGELTSQKVKLPSPHEVVNTYLENRIDVKIAEISVEQAKLNKWNTVSSSWLPSLNFSERLSVSENAASSAIGGSSSSGKVGVNGTFSASVSIPLSGLIPGSSESLNVKTKDDAVKSAQITAEQTRKAAKSDILTKFSRISVLWNSLEVARMNENISKRSYELSKEGYNAGLVSQTDLETSRQQYVTSQQTVLQSQINYLSALYAAKQAINISMEDFYEKFAETSVADGGKSE